MMEEGEGGKCMTKESTKEVEFGSHRNVYFSR